MKSPSIQSLPAFEELHLESARTKRLPFSFVCSSFAFYCIFFRSYLASVTTCKALIAHVQQSPACRSSNQSNVCKRTCLLTWVISDGKYLIDIATVRQYYLCTFRCLA